jgi:hypothetical protein
MREVALVNKAAELGNIPRQPLIGLFRKLIGVCMRLFELLVFSPQWVGTSGTSSPGSTKREPLGIIAIRFHPYCCALRGPGPASLGAAARNTSVRCGRARRVSCCVLTEVLHKCNCSGGTPKKFASFACIVLSST